MRKKGSGRLRPVPRLFIGSSTEAMPVARSVRDALRGAVSPVLWEQVFRVGESFIDSLLRVKSDFSYAVIVLTPDDMVTTRGDSLGAPRDNLLFELGLFMAALGRDRVFMICPREARIKLPTDLAGISYAVIFKKNSTRFDASVRSACRRIQEAISQVEASQEAAKLSAMPSLRAPARFPILHWDDFIPYFPRAGKPDFRHAAKAIDEGDFLKAERLLARRRSLPDYYLRSRLAVCRGDGKAARDATRVLLQRASEVLRTRGVESNAYFFFEVAARRMLKLFGEVEMVEKLILHLRGTVRCPDLDHLLAMVRVAQGKWGKALELYESAIGGGSANVWSHIDKLRCLMQMGRESDFRRVVLELQRRFPDNIDIECLLHWSEPWGMATEECF